MKKLINLTITVAAILFANNFAIAQTGNLPADLDSTFGGNRSGIINLGATVRGLKGVITGTNDRIYVNSGFSFSVHKPNGSQITNTNCPFYFCNSMTLQGNGYVILAGYDLNGNLGIARYDSNLLLDQTFGNGGIVLAAFNQNEANSPNDILEFNGQIYVTGSSGKWGAANQFVARFNSNGSLDTNFANTGFVIEDSISFGNALAIQKTNIVVAGASLASLITTITVYDQFGQRASSFNGGQIFEIAGREPFVKVDRKNRIIFTGPILMTTNLSGGIARLKPNGAFDPSFGGTGIVWIPIQDSLFVNAIMLDSNKRITIAGEWYVYVNGQYSERPFIARYDDPGNLDRSFENSIPPQYNYPPGIRIFDFGTNDPRLFTHLALQSSGKILVGECQPFFTPLNCQLYRFNGN
jgi:uncharacterized delta-60 repeat protein